MEFKASVSQLQEKTESSPKYLNPETLGVEFCWENDDLAIVDELPSHPSDALGRLIFDGCPSAKARIAKTVDLLESGLPHDRLQDLAHDEYERFWRTGGKLRMYWRGAEHRYPQASAVINIRHWQPSSDLLLDCEEAGYSHEKVSECLAQMQQQSLFNGRYAKYATSTAGEHSKNLIKWLQYVHPDHDSGWTVPWPDVLGDKHLKFWEGPKNPNFFPTMYRVFREGYQNRYGRLHGGIEQRLINLQHSYEKMIERNEGRDIFFGKRQDDFFYMRTVPRTGMLCEVEDYRPSPELFRAAERAGMSPELIKQALDNYRQTATSRFDDVALHEWRMQRYLYHHAVLAGIDARETFDGSNSLYRDVASPSACIRDLRMMRGLLKVAGNSQAADPIIDQWNVFGGDYPSRGPQAEPDSFRGPAPLNFKKDPDKPQRDFFDGFVLPDDPEEAAEWKELMEMREQKKLAEERKKRPKVGERQDDGWQLN